ncbi:MAG: DUF2336 domain-containing protein [Beijerinckiaceae bacterium]
MMIIRRFLQWAKTASPGQRAEGASALARAYLYSDLSASEREEAEHALTGLLDDPSPLVRRALAESFAGAAEAPHHILLALADDQSDIAAIVLARSLALSESELIDCAAIGDAIAQSAIAIRPRLTPPLAAALAEIGAREALISLAVNPSAEIPEFSLRRMIERFGADGELREALLSRPNLPPALRAELVAVTAEALSAFITARDWISPERATRVTREARELAHVIIAATSQDEPDGPRQLVAHLRSCGQLTAGLLLRALLSGNEALFEASLIELSDLPASRVRGLMHDWCSVGFAALYRKAKLPEALLPSFRAALEALYTIETVDNSGARLSRQRIERVLTSCAAVNRGELDKLLAVLRRLDAEAAREEARDFSAALPVDDEPRPRIDAAQPLIPDEPLLLTDLDWEAAPPRRAEALTRRIEPRLIMVDLAALEAELAAA